jgi:photosynthetic reaction center cytochrome c subunit
MNLIAKTLRIALPTALIGVLLAGCGEKPPITVSQTGFRGTAMQQNYNERILATQVVKNTPPVAAAAIAETTGVPLAKDVYQNVKVLGDVNVAEFGRTMNAITEWVSPQQGCTYCHIEGNFADDSKYTKTVARRMLQMTQHINADWKTHVAETGVTCYTCHRGNNVPTETWFKPAEGKSAGGSMADTSGQNRAAKSVGYASLPYDPFTPYLLGNSSIRVNGSEALKITGPQSNQHSTKQAEFTFGLMTHMSTSLGVNCTYCHNTRSFDTWEGESTPKRATAWYGIRMARDLNVNYLEPLGPVYPPHRMGPTGDAAKANCSTCHQGAFKPLYGAAMAKDYPALKAPAAAAAAPANSATGPAGAEVAPAKIVAVSSK